jgi:hypothetical protein
MSGPSTNGTPQANGVPAAESFLNHLNGSAPSLATAVDDGGRSPQTGRFALGNKLGVQFEPGNKAGRGNASFKRLAANRREFTDAISADEVRALARKLYAQALAGDLAAAKLVLSYCLGRPSVAEDPDAGAQRELQLAARWPGAVEALALLSGHIDAAEAIDKIRGTSNPALFRALADKLVMEQVGKR